MRGISIVTCKRLCITDLIETITCKGSQLWQQLYTTKIKKGFMKTTDYRPTDTSTTYHLPTDTPTSYPPTYVKTEDQILNIFCIL